MSLVSIRSIQPDEVTAVLELWKAAGLVAPPNQPDRDIRAARSDGGDVFVAEWEQRLVATIMVGREEDRGWLYYLAVEPGLQRKGLGRAIVRYAEKWLRARGVTKVMLMIRANNRNVRGFYDKLGYKSEPKNLMARALEPLPKPGAPPNSAPKLPAASAD
ncbi:MAG: GNAT family acetyltransferase [Alphaproteobacteria bacterium]|nr:GNAT family acetyltransferase [Alphaproteobacteria bacterium]